MLFAFVRTGYSRRNLSSCCIHLISSSALFACIFFLCGCTTYSAYNISSPQPPILNPAPAKFYVQSINGIFLKAEEISKIKQELPMRYPSFFAKTKDNAIPVNFYWKIEYDHSGSDTASLSGLTLGIIPCLIFKNHTGELSAKLTSHGSSSENSNAVVYTVSEKEILHMLDAAIITDPIAAMCISSGADLTSSYFASTNEMLSVPLYCCNANLRLFPNACALLYSNLTENEKEKIKMSRRTSQLELSI